MAEDKEKVTYALAHILSDLESNKLEVVLVPLDPRKHNWNEGGCKRVAVCVPPAWYRRLCAANPSSRGVRRGGFDTRIRRANVLRAIARLASGKYTGKYRDDLLRIARSFPLCIARAMPPPAPPSDDPF